jgi:hypothetical protein
MLRILFTALLYIHRFNNQGGQISRLREFVNQVFNNLVHAAEVCERPSQNKGLCGAGGTTSLTLRCGFVHV